MYIIYKYVFKVDDFFSVVMPGPGAQILKIGIQPGIQHGFYCMWVLVNTEGILVERKFRTFGTGHKIDSLLGPPSLHYIDSVIDDSYVWHFFEAI
jgi:hypothetical protein